MRVALLALLVASTAHADPYAKATLRERVTYLASKELDGRAPGTAGDVAARAWVVERFTASGLTPAFEGSFEQPFTAGTAATANVVGYLPGETDEIIFIGAHLDHMGKGYLGANDNASGVVALVAVAEALAARTTTPRRTIAFGVFGAEERGMVGSYFFAAKPATALPVGKIVQFINLDMVGTHAARGYVAALGTFKGLAATRTLAKLDDAFPKLTVAMGGRARGSDFEPFCKAGVPYVFFWTPDPRCYHETCDTARRLDYARMADIAKLAGALAQTMADTTDDLGALRASKGCGLPQRRR